MEIAQWIKTCDLNATGIPAGIVVDAVSTDRPATRGACVRFRTAIGVAPYATRVVPWVVKSRGDAASWTEEETFTLEKLDATLAQSPGFEDLDTRAQRMDEVARRITEKGGTIQKWMNSPIGGDPNLEMRLLAPGNIAANLSVEGHEKMEAYAAAGSPWIKTTEVMTWFPVRSSAVNNTLIFYHSFWMCAKFDGMDNAAVRFVVNVDTGLLAKFSSSSSASLAAIVPIDVLRGGGKGKGTGKTVKRKRGVTDDVESLGIAMAHSSTPVTHEVLYAAVAEKFVVAEEREGEAWTWANDGSRSASELKSAMQKILRRQPGKIGTQTGHTWLMATAVSLFTHPGSFLPALGQFERGALAFSRRVPISIFEDASVSDSAATITDRRALVGMFAFASALGRKPQLADTVSIETVCSWFDVLSRAFSRNRAYVFETRTTEEIKTLDPDSRTGDIVEVAMRLPLTVCDWLLRGSLHSFPTDETMVSWIAWRPRAWIKAPAGIAHSNEPTPAFLYDQHVEPTLTVLQANVASVHKYLSTMESPPNSLAGYFRQLFREVGGINPRRGQALRVDTPFVADAIKVQRNIEALIASGITATAKLHDGSRAPAADDVVSYALDVELTDEMLAGWIGDTRTRDGIVVLPLHGGSDYLAVRNPSIRAGEYKPFNARQTEAVIQAAYSKTRATARRLRGPDMPVSLGGTTFKFLNVEERASGQSLFKHIHTLDGTRLPRTLKLMFTRTDVEPELDTKLAKLVEEDAPVTVLQRALLVAGMRTGTHLRFPRVGRSGLGVDAQVTHNDPAAFQFWQQIAQWAPGIITLDPKGRDGFVIGAPLVISVWVRRFSDVLSRRICAAASAAAYTSTAASGGAGGGASSVLRAAHLRRAPFVYSDGRESLEHQRAAFEALVDKDTRGVRRHFLYMRTGKGKTHTFLNYAAKHISDGNIDYALVSTPKSAIGTVLDEAAMFGFPVTLLVPSAGSKVVVPAHLRTQVRELRGKAVLAAGAVHRSAGVIVIEHDSLRHKGLAPILHEIAPNSLVVIDEAHKAMSATQRTSHAQTIVGLSRIAVLVTGTPVLNNDQSLVAMWLQFGVAFPITKSTFFTAAGSIVAHGLEETIEIVRTTTVVPLEGDVLRKYLAIVPPSLGGIADNNRFRVLDAARFCYDATATAMAEQVRKHMVDGVMLVAFNAKHARVLEARCIEAGVSAEVIKRVSGGESFSLKSLDASTVRVVIVPIRHCEGYSLIGLGRIVTSVYFTNLATRVQIEGRLRRVDQRRERIHVDMVLCSGILERLLKSHASAASLEAALKRVSTQ